MYNKIFTKILDSAIHEAELPKGTTISTGCVVVEPDGTKLSKSRSSAAVAALAPTTALRLALQLLRQPEPPPGLDNAHDLHTWAAMHWNPAALSGMANLHLPTVDLAGTPNLQLP